MATKVREIMTPDPTVVAASEPAADAARRMRDRDIGDVLVEEDGTLRGIVTDRDLAVRVIDDGTAVGVLSIGDLAVSRDPGSALADISAAPGND